MKTLNINDAVFERFKEHCKNHALKMSRLTELLLEQYLNDFEDKLKKNEF